MNLRLLFHIGWMLICVGSLGCTNTKNVTWIRHDAGPFTLEIPSNLAKTDENGVDSYGNVFESQSMQLYWDFGFYSNDFSDWAPSTKLEQVTVDSRPAVIGDIPRGDLDPFKYLIQIHFSKIHGVNGEKLLTIGAKCKNTSDFKIAREIFESIRFKASPYEKGKD